MGSLRRKFVPLTAAISLFGAATWALTGTAGAVWAGTDGKLVYYQFSGTEQAPVAQIFSMNRPGNGQKNLSAKGGAANQVDIQVEALPPQAAPSGSVTPTAPVHPRNSPPVPAMQIPPCRTTAPASRSAVRLRGNGICSS